MLWPSDTAIKRNRHWIRIHSFCGTSTTHLLIGKATFRHLTASETSLNYPRSLQEIHIFLFSIFVDRLIQIKTKQNIIPNSPFWQIAWHLFGCTVRSHRHANDSEGGVWCSRISTAILTLKITPWMNGIRGWPMANSSSNHINLRFDSIQCARHNCDILRAPKWCHLHCVKRRHGTAPNKMKHFSFTLFSTYIINNNRLINYHIVRFHNEFSI